MTEFPEEVKCFICLKDYDDYKIVAMEIHCKDSIVEAGIAVCNDDFNWILAKPDAARGLIQSRLKSIVEREDNNSDY